MTTCYMCDKRATSNEHVPPKCLFPEQKDLPAGLDFRKNLITVPSCDEHNSSKSKDDEYLLFVIVSAAQGNIDKQRHFDSKVIRAAKRKPHVFSSFFRDLKPAFIQFEDGRVEPSACFRVDVARYERAIQHISCGLFFHHYKRKWLGESRIFTNAMFDATSSNAPDVNETIQKVAYQISRAFSGQPVYGDNGNIFSYRIYSEGDRHAMFLAFYEGLEVTVLLP